MMIAEQNVWEGRRNDAGAPIEPASTSPTAVATADRRAREAALIALYMVLQRRNTN
jgi:hypothetical protein